MARPERIAREDIAPAVGRRMIVRCLSPACDHAALIDQRRLFPNPRDWPRSGASNRFRCVCGSRQADVRYTHHADAVEGTIHPDTLRLWF